MKICICDDDINIHKEIELLLQPFSTTETTTSITNVFSGEKLIKFYSSQNYFDIIFLDVEMSQTNGIQTAEKIRQSDPNVIIIFISNYETYVFDAFRFDALHFIRKPIAPNEFSEVFQRAINKYRSINSSITLKWQNERYIIKIDTIKYIEGYKRHITVYTKEGIYESLGKIPDLLKELAPHGFIRTHQGFLVNMDYIKRFDTTDVVLFDGTKVMISVRKRAEALQQFDKYLKSKKW